MNQRPSASDSSDRGRVIERIRKLLALSRDPANEHEAALAAAKVRELLLEHNLALGDITLASKSTEQCARRGVRLPVYFTPLCHACKTLFDTEWLVIRRHFIDGVLSEIVFCGLPQNVATSLLAFDYFVAAIRSLMLAREDLRGQRQRHSYQKGAASRIWTEARKLKESAQASPDTTALIHIGNAIARRHLERHQAREESAPKVRPNISFAKGWLDAGGIDLARAGRKQVNSA